MRDKESLKHLKIFKLFGVPSEELGDFFNELNAAYEDVAFIEWTTRGFDTKVNIYFNSEKVLKHIAYDIASNFSENIYSDKNVSLHKCLFEYLNFQKKVLSVAESLTGGIISDRLVSIDGASKILFEGLVVYSNESKMNRLKVSANTLKTFGAVSDETCFEMAQGLINTEACDIAIATTGIAGSGGTAKKPVGLTFIGIGTKEGIHIYKHIFKGTRQEIRNLASDFAFFYAINHLKGSGDKLLEIK
jgi:PncC family amidohydrolase